MNAGSLVLGTLNGFIVGLLAIGLVLVYRANKFLNLAHAQLGALPALLLAKFAIDWGWNWWAAIVPCLAVGVGSGLAVDRLIMRRLRRRTKSTVTLLLATLGVTQVLLALTYLPALGPNNDKLDVVGYPLPFHSHLTVGSVVLGGQYVLILILSPLLAAAIGLFLRYTTMGKMIRAAASNADAARLAGVSVGRASAVTWAIAGGLAAITAVLQAPSQGSFNAEALGPGLLLLALGAAAFGAFVSIPAALIGGLVLGLADQITLAVTSSAGDGEMAVLVTILAVIMLRGKAIAAAFGGIAAVVDDQQEPRVPEPVRARAVVTRRPIWLGGSLLMVAVLIPLVPYFRTQAHTFELTLVLVNAIVGLSLTVLIGWAGQVSLGHFAVVGVGAFFAARYASHNWSLLLLLLVAGGVGAVTMTIVGLPALRVRGLSLTVTSLGLAVVAPDWLFHQSWFGSAQSFGEQVFPTHIIFGLGSPSSQRDMYYTTLVVLLAALMMVKRLRRSLPGRIVIAVRDNEKAAQTFGITPATVRLATLAFTGFLAAVAGVLWADTWRSVEAAQFDPGLSLAILAAPVIGGLGSAGGAIAGSVFLFMSTYFLAPNLSFLFGQFGEQIGFQLALGGVSLLAVLMSYPTGLAGVGRKAWEYVLAHLAGRYEERSPIPDPVPLVVQNASVRFGGLSALSGASIAVGDREIVGLIGPNGAGKSTLMNVISGGLAPESGTVTIMGVDVTRLQTEYRCALGLGRSFQDARLFPGLTVSESIQVAMSRSHRVSFLSAALQLPWARMANKASRIRSGEVVARFGLDNWSDSLVSDLSTGTRRICDLAAQVASGPKLLLLDEPTAGVAQREAEAFGAVLRQIRDELGCSMLIVEHDMPLLMGLCDRIYAMEAGRVIAEGTSDEIRSNPAVIASYLGSSQAAAARSGSRPPKAAAVRRSRSVSKEKSPLS